MLWFDHQAEEPATFYVSVFENAAISEICRYSKAGQEIHKQREGAVMTVAFELDGQSLTALNGGPLFKFTEAVSLQVMCNTQHEIDRDWEALSQGGDPKAQECGWLKGKYGLSWQIVPTMMSKLVKDHTSAGARRVMTAMLGMKKLDLAALRARVRR